MENEKVISTEALIAKFQYAYDNAWGYIWGTAGVMWTAEKQKELEKTTDSSRESGRLYGSKWIGHMVADCSGLFAWAFKQLGGTMYHGSNTMYLHWCTAKGQLKNGRRTDGQDLKPGTAVFTYNSAKENYSHVGLYIGNGVVIEAKGTKAGVTKSKITDSRWTNWGELKGVSYGPGAPEKPQDEPANQGGGNTMPTLRRGDKGEYVTLAQTMLANRGYDLGSCGVDGDFGRATEAAVKAFQMDHGLTADGVIGPKTWAALDGPQTQTYTVTVRGLTLSQADALLNQYPGSSKTEER